MFELLIINNLRSICYMPPHQFGFQPKLGCFHALKYLCNLLIDADKSGGTLALGTYDVSKAFDSLLHPQAMNELLNRGVSLDLVRPLLYRYRHMKAKIRIPGSNLLTDDIPIHIGVKQGAVTSPTIYNNATLPAQCQLSSCCIYKGTDLSVLCYADDVVNISRTISGLEKCFLDICKNYSDIGLSLNAEKCDVLIFNEIDTH